FLLLKVIEAPMIQVPIVLHDYPPHGIGWNTIDEFWKGGIISGKIKTFWNNFIEAENTVNRHQFWMHIASPYHTVAFNSIQQIILHIKMNGISAGFPYFV